jgi:hypothetical protein
MPKCGISYGKTPQSFENALAYQHIFHWGAFLISLICGKCSNWAAAMALYSSYFMTFFFFLGQQFYFSSNFFFLGPLVKKSHQKVESQSAPDHNYNM